MIEVDHDAAHKIFIAEATGEVTAEDYETRLAPALERAIASDGPVRMLYRFGPAFTGFSVGAMWSDMQLGLRHMRDIDRIAVVSDHAMISGLVHAFSYLLPMPVRVFDGAGMAEARAWLLDDSGT